MNALVMLVGHLADDIKIEENEHGGNVAKLKLIVPRPYKNENGIYENDTFEVQSWGSLSNHIVDYVKKGCLIGVKGRLQTKDNNVIIVAEKITFLSHEPNKEEK